MLEAGVKLLSRELESRAKSDEKETEDSQVKSKCLCVKDIVVSA